MLLKFQLNSVHEVNVDPNDVLYTHLLENNWTNCSVFYNKSKLDIYTQIRFLNLVNHCVVTLAPIKNESIQINISFNNAITKYSANTTTLFKDIAQLVTPDPVDIRIQNLSVSPDVPCQLGNLTKVMIFNKSDPNAPVIAKPKELQSSKPKDQLVITQVVAKKQEPPKSTPIAIHTANNDESSEINRNIQIYKPVQHQNKIELSDDFFTLSGAELKYLVHQQQNYVHGIEEKPLKTQSMREKEIEEKLKKSPRVIIY